MTTADYALQAVKGIKTSFDNAATNDLLQYKNVPIFSYETTSEFTEIFTSTEGMSGVIELAEGQTPPTLTLSDGRSVSLSDKTYGGAIEITRKMMLQAKDSTTMIDKFITRQRNQILQTGRQNFLTNVYMLLNDAFAGTYYLAPDGVALAGTHSWVNGNTFSNAGTAVLSQSAWDAVVEIGGAAVDSAGKFRPITYDTIIVKLGSAAATMAKKLFANGITPTSVADINIYNGTVKVVEVPGITSANKNFWFAMDSKIESPLYIGINNMPYLDEPIPQNNGSVRSNMWADYKVGINNMPYGIYASNGTV